MGGRRAQRAWRVEAAVVAALLAVLVSLCAGPAIAGSADELVRQAHAHEAAREDDLAVRRYTEALEVDRTNPDAWLGLGALRLRLADAAEAERVYATALEQSPTLRRALEGRAHARWVLGRHAEAEADLEQYAAAVASDAVDGDSPVGPAASLASAAPLRELAGWFGADGRTPAQLAVWRKLLAMARAGNDGPLEREARRMVRALLILVDGADPAASPVDPDATRRALGAIAGRGG